MAKAKKPITDGMVEVEVNFSSIQIDGVDYIAEDGIIVVPAELVEIVKSHG